MKGFIKKCLVAAAMLGCVGTVAISNNNFSLLPIVEAKAGDSYDEPVWAKNFAEFKSAMEDSTVTYVRIAGIQEQLPSTDVYSAAINVTGTKKLIVDGNNSFVSNSGFGYDCLLQTNGLSDLTIMSSGTLSFSPKLNNASNAVLSINGGNVTIDSYVTLDGTPVNHLTYGRAIQMYYGSLNISDGKYVSSNAFDDKRSTIDIKGGSFTISGGKFNAPINFGTEEFVCPSLTISDSASGSISGGSFEGLNIRKGSGDVNLSDAKTVKDYLTTGYYTYDNDSNLLASNVNKISENFEVSQTRVTELDVTVEGYEIGKNVADATVTCNTEGLEIVSFSFNTEDTTFVLNNSYMLTVFFNSKSGYNTTKILQENVTVNGETPRYFNNPWHSPSDGEIRIYHALPKITPIITDYVTELDLSIEGYENGKNSEDVTVIVNTEGLEISKVVWDDAGVFTTGNRYYVDIFLNPKLGYAASGLIEENVKVNGEAPDYFDNPWHTPSDGEIRVRIRLPYIGCHDFTGQSYHKNSDGTHYQFCKYCGVKSESVSCSGGTATCKTLAVCEYCGNSYGNYADHLWDDKYTVDTEPSCTFDGFKSIHCLTCSETKDIVSIDALGHTGGTATCKEKAVCDRCHLEYGSYGDHAYGDVIPEVSATCTLEGIQAHYQCSVCDLLFNLDKIQTEIKWLKIEMASHQYEWIIDTEATTEHTGLKHEKCKNCESTRSEGTIIDKLECEHSLVKINGVPATCQSAGTKEYYACSKCLGEFEDETGNLAIIDIGTWKIIPILDHSYGDLIQEVPATCTASGTKAHYQCSECEKYFEANKIETTEVALIIEATGHSYGDWTKVDDNSHKHICGKCSDEITENHVWNEGEITSQPTHTTIGIKIFKCTLCNATKDVTIEKDTNHVYGDLIAEVPATCTATGTKAHYECTCGKLFDANHEEITDLVLATNNNHSYGELIAEVPATNTTNGTKAHYVCGNCNKTFDTNYNEITDLVIPMLVCTHANLTKTNEVAATQDSYGVKAYYTCDNCHKHYEDETGTTEITNIDSWKLNAGKVEKLEPTTPTNPVDPTPSNPPEPTTPEDNKNDNSGLSGGAIAGIVIGSVVLVSLAGFAVFWFVIKKKSFADLLKVFKK